MTGFKVTFGLAGTMALMVACGPKYPNCNTDEICSPRNEVCVNGMCRPCRDDSKCMAANACGICDNYSCTRRPGCCTSDLDCPNGRCWNVPGQPFGQCGAQCDAEHPCPPGQRCNANGVCEPDTECSPSVPCPPGKRCVNGRCESDCALENVYFDFNESRLRSDAQRTLNANGDCIKGGGRSVRIEGHCDERGTEEYNMALGERRALSAKKYLTNLGISDGSLRTISYGEEKPTCTESDESCWSKNRRAEFNWE